MNIEFDEAREIMYDTLAEEFGEETINDVLEDAVKQRLTDMYDRRDDLELRQ